MNKFGLFGLVLNPQERKVLQVAVAHLLDVSEDINDTEIANTCKELLKSLK